MRVSCDDRRSMAWRSILPAGALLVATGCKPTLPACDPDPLEGAEPTTPGFMVVPQARVEAWNLISPEWSPVMVATDLYFGAPAAGATIGYVNLDGESGLAMGASILRFYDGIRLHDGGDESWRASVLLPDINGHMVFIMAPGDPVLFLSATTDVTGLRFSHCLGEDTCFQTSLRGPTIGPAMGFVDPLRIRVGDEPLGILVLGGELDAGFRF